MKKILAILLAVTLIFSCIAIPASAAEGQSTPAVAAASEGSFFETLLSRLFAPIISFFENLFSFLSIEEPEEPTTEEPTTEEPTTEEPTTEEPTIEEPKPYLIAKQDTVTIDREKNLVYGFKFNLKTNEISEYVGVNDENIGKLEISNTKNDLAGTGAVVKVTDNKGETVESFELVIFGDIDGDADIDNDDYKMAQDEGFLITTWSLDDFGDEYSASKTAACDLNKDKHINATDVTIIRDCIAGYLKIDQATGTVSRIPRLSAQVGKENVITIDRENNIVYGFEFNLKATEVKDYVDVYDERFGKLEISNTNGDFAGTGTVLTVIDNDSNIIESFEIVIFGDIDGDSDIDIDDYDMALDECLMLTTWSLDDFGDEYSFVKTTACDLNKDKHIDSIDVSIIRDCIAGYLRIDQTTGTVTRIPRLVPQADKEDTITIDRENNIVYGFDTRIKKDEVTNYVTTSNEKIGKVEVECARNGYFAPFAGTGSIIKVIDTETNEVIESFTMIIFGDLNGDSYIQSVDASISGDEVDGVTSWSDENSEDYSFAMTIAADVDRDGVISENDTDRIVDHCLGIIRIDQTSQIYTQPEIPEIHLVAKKDSVVIDRRNNIVYGLDTMLKRDEIFDFVAVNDETKAKVEVKCARNGYFAPFAGTGSTINVVDTETNEVIESFTLIVFGDLNGDSAINATDSSMASSELDGHTSWSDPLSDEYSQLKITAADIDNNGAITEADADLITEYCLGIIDINQSTREIIRA